ncbi:hypothetical protein DEO72_LG8g2560 [Vigna unguiculata]|uniref:Uncharacterized protein n=2 Tax=Vigna unguiculata TaxID=3917 RepID=A0A4D6MUU9_VIGUN|nr:hypothetical protein DEO72_LG8g2560 [Vigna unguiculata]
MEIRVVVKEVRFAGAGTAWRHPFGRQAPYQRVLGLGAPGDRDSSARRSLLREQFKRRCAPGGTRHPPGGLEAVVPSGTCPPLGDLAAALGAWRYVSPARRSRSWQRLAARVPRQAIRTAAALNLDCVCVIYVASNGALKVGLLEFLELWLGTCGSGWRMDTRNPGVVARVGECCRCECAGCGQYGWVQMDCPPQLLADEFGSLGTIRTMFVYGNSTWRCGV